MKTKEDIALVIVLYNPSSDDLKFIKAISSIYFGIIVDNSQIRNFTEDEIGKMVYKPLMENTGIAHAQNIALRYLMNHKCPQYVLFMDQDSRYSQSFPCDMTLEYKRIKENIPNLFLLGPDIINKETGTEYKSIFHHEKNIFNGFVSKREIISSGSIADWKTITKIRFMINSLFIDFVDFEWCWRARRMGYVCGITKNVILKHKVGIHSKSVCKYTFMTWSSIRYYYQYRNYLWLTRTAYTPLQWRLATGIKFVLRLIYFPLFMSDGVACWKQMIKGISDSFRNYSIYKKEILRYEV